MKGFIGEYYCKLDDKARLLLPSDMRKQLAPTDSESFVVSRGVDDCLSLYTNSEWDRVMEKLRSLNRFKVKDRKFARMFQKGATRISLDSNGRVLFPKNLMEWAGIQKDIVLVANVDLWEIWDKKRYESLLSEDWSEFENLAAEVMGDDDGDN
jgi:MraZ protein